jgi:nicotinamide-nucleotide amidase
MTGIGILTVSAAHLAATEEPGAMVARALVVEGVPVRSREVVDEDEAALEPAIRAALDAHGLVVLLALPGGSGGEIVPRTIARLAGARLVLHERLLELMQQDFASRGQAMPRRLDRQALLPQGAEIWPVASGEPAWRLETPGGMLVVLPASSRHLPALVAEQLAPLARTLLPAGEAVVVRTLRTVGLGPAEAEERLAPWLGKEDGVSVSCLLVDGDVWVRLRARGASRGLAERALAEVEAEVERALGEDCYGRDGDTLEAVVGRMLVERGLGLSVAESCTGGLLGHRLTGVPGSSRYFERGVIAYSNQAKEEMLGVPAELLRVHGAVSAPVARAMAEGVLRQGRSQCALAITGIAGPDGGTPDKPVGTVFVASATPGALEVRRFRFRGAREAVKWQSSQAALDMLRRSLST